MRIAENTGGYSSFTVSTNYTKPTSKGGATLGGHSFGSKSQANVNGGVTKLGAVISVYSSALAILLGADDF